MDSVSKASVENKDLCLLLKHYTNKMGRLLKKSKKQMWERIDNLPLLKRSPHILSSVYIQKFESMLLLFKALLHVLSVVISRNIEKAFNGHTSTGYPTKDYFHYSVLILVRNYLTYSVSV